MKCQHLFTMLSFVCVWYFRHPDVFVHSCILIHQITIRSPRDCYTVKFERDKERKSEIDGHWQIGIADEAATETTVKKCCCVSRVQLIASPISPKAYIVQLYIVIKYTNRCAHTHTFEWAKFVEHRCFYFYFDRKQRVQESNVQTECWHYTKIIWQQCTITAHTHTHMSSKASPISLSSQHMPGTRDLSCHLYLTTVESGNVRTEMEIRMKENWSNVFFPTDFLRALH